MTTLQLRVLARGRQQVPGLIGLVSARVSGRLRVLPSHRLNHFLNLLSVRVNVFLKKSHEQPLKRPQTHSADQNDKLLAHSLARPRGELSAHLGVSQGQPLTSTQHPPSRIKVRTDEKVRTEGSFAVLVSRCVPAKRESTTSTRRRGNREIQPAARSTRTLRLRVNAREGPATGQPR